MSDPYTTSSSGKTNKLKKVRPQVFEGPVEASQEVISNIPPAPVGPRTLSAESRAGIRKLEEAMRDQHQKDRKAVEVAKAAKADDDEGLKVELGEVDEETAKKFATVFYRNTPLDNPKTRRAIEARCSKMDFDELIITGRALQAVPIVKDKLTVVFQSLQTRDLIWIDTERAERFKGEAADGLDATAWAGYAKLALSTVRINDKEFVNCFSTEGAVDVELFERKYLQVIESNDKLTEALFVNYGWFEDRVLKMFSPEEGFETLKNG